MRKSKLRTQLQELNEDSVSSVLDFLGHSETPEIWGVKISNLLTDCEDKKCKDVYFRKDDRLQKPRLYLGYAFPDSTLFSFPSYTEREICVHNLETELSFIPDSHLD